MPYLKLSIGGLVGAKNSHANNLGVEKPEKRAKEALLTEENRAESVRLKALYEKSAHGLSQAAFGDTYDIGSQGTVWQCLNGKGMPISLKAAQGFAAGLKCQISDFSPRLAKLAEGIAHSISDANGSASIDKSETINTRHFGNGAPAPNASGIPPHKFKPVWVVGRGAGGLMPESIWSDGDYPAGATENYAEIASQDEHAFLTEVVGTSMVPRYNPGEYALVEPGTDPDIEDDVLVRLKDGQTLLKRLLSRRGGYRLGSYNSAEILFYELDQVTWIYYVAHPVPRRKIKQRAGADIDLNW